MNLGPTELVIVLAILLSYVLPLWAIVDAATRPEVDYQAIGASKTTQIVVLVVSALFCGIIGTLVSVFYLLGARTQLRAAAAGRA